MRATLHVECCVVTGCRVARPSIAAALHGFITGHLHSVLTDAALPGDWTSVPLLRSNIRHVRVCEVSGGSQGVVNDGAGWLASSQVQRVDAVDVHIHVYELNDAEPGDEIMDSGDAEQPSSSVAMMQQWSLPTTELDGAWESLVFDSNVKLHLIRFVMTAMMFAQHRVDSNIISFNRYTAIILSLILNSLHRVVLLHGPPGTGKTTLCRAIAQKLAIRLSSPASAAALVYPFTRLVEINSHSLFSKWFSESGKLVARAFKEIHEMAEDDECFVCVLIDEVESLTSARNAAMSGSEPSDAIRVVNAVLTQVDRLKHRPNVLVLTTSNISQAIDLAFVDRADVKQYIGPPSLPAVYAILQSCVLELVRARIVVAGSDGGLMDWQTLTASLGDSNDNDAALSYRNSAALREIAEQCVGMSGRSLRRLPFLAHAHHVESPGYELSAFLGALHQTVQHELCQTEQLKVSNM